MSIVFKLGEHYYEANEGSILIQFILTTFGAFLGFGFALLLYYINNRLDKKKQNNKQTVDNLNKIKYYKLLIENIIDDTKRQMSSLDKFNKEQAKDLLDIKIPMKVPTNDIKRLITINKDIFEAFNDFNHQDDKWIENLRKMHTNIDFIEATLSEISIITSRHLESCMRNIIDIKQKIELIPDRLSSFAFFLQKELGETRWQNDLYTFIDTEIKNYGELINQKADFNTFENEYLKPLIEKIMDNFKEEPFLEEIIFLSKNSRVKMTDIKTEVTDLMETFEGIQSSLDRSITKIGKLNNNLLSSINFDYR